MLGVKGILPLNGYIGCFDVLQLPQHRFVQRPLNIWNPSIYYVNGSLRMFSGIMTEYIYRFLLEKKKKKIPSYKCGERSGLIRQKKTSFDLTPTPYRYIYFLLGLKLICSIYL